MYKKKIYCYGIGIIELTICITLLKFVNFNKNNLAPKFVSSPIEIRIPQLL